tara:strand:+ start:36471 stop:36695 length:225 start_codon:yes stop_codon:yes gene_type:complete
MNKKIVAKFPIKCGEILIPKGVTGYVLDEPTSRIKESFPDIKFNSESNQILVQFNYRDTKEIIVHKTQIEYERN